MYLTTTIFWMEMNDITIPKAKLLFLKNRVDNQRLRMEMLEDREKLERLLAAQRALNTM